ncbi:hypothetical protein REMIM1_CH00941 [Rhizobium etli bv. mimosae str. Mim1]|nr:hypothetical protein REMIM1_CH00941 [Rhizobium etli bv. mimosae str. Mim1]
MLEYLSLSLEALLCAAEVPAQSILSGLRPSRGRSSGKEDGLRGGFDPIHDQRIPIEARRRYSEPGMQRCGRARQERQEATGNDDEAVYLFRQAGAKTGQRPPFGFPEFSRQDGSTHEKTASRAVAGALWTHETRHAMSAASSSRKCLITVLSMHFS